MPVILDTLQRVGRSINQQCIFTAVQVIKSLQDPLKWGIIQRGQITMSGTTRGTETVLDAGRRSTENEQRSHCPADCSKWWLRMPLLTATGVFGLGRRRWSSPQQVATLPPYLHRHRIDKCLDTRRPIATTADLVATDLPKSHNHKMSDCPCYY